MKSKHWLLFCVVLYLVVFGAVASIGGANRGLLSLAMISLLPFAGLAAIVIVSLSAMFVPIAFHELGHYAMGRLVKFEFFAAAVGPFGLRVEKDRVEPFRVRPAWNGGYVVMLPPDDHQFRGRFAVFVLGGPLFSLLWVLASLAAWPAFGFGVWEGIPPRAPIGDC